MRSLRAWLVRFGGSFASRTTHAQLESQIADELDANLQLHIDDNVRAGMPPAEARRTAMLALGGLEQTKERYRDRRGLPVVETLARDVRHACRRLRRTPGVVLAILLTLAAALGLNASVFAVADALFLRPFSFPNIDRLVLIEETRPDWPWRGLTSPANFRDWERTRPATLAELSAFRWRELEVGGRDNPEQLHGTAVSANFFDVTGVKPARGRWFVADEETPGRHRRVVLSHPLWLRRFHGNADVVGQSVEVDGLPYDIVGIAPPGFDFPFNTHLWVPLAFDAKDLTDRNDRFLLVAGRLAEHATVDSVQNEMTIVAQEIARQYERSGFRSGARVRTLTAGMREQDSGAVHAFLQASAFFVLLIACTNITNLLLALGVERQREVAVRFALGATRLQIFRSLWIESAVLAMVAVPLALLVADVGLDLIRNSLPPRLALLLPGWQHLDVDGRLTGFAVILAVLAALLFGLFPAVQSSRPKPDALKESARGLTAGVSRQRVRRALIVAQVALVVPLLSAATAAWRGASSLANAPQGYEPDRLLTMRLMLPERRYQDAKARRQFAAALHQELTSLPAVAGAAFANNLPSSGLNEVRQVAVEGRSSSPPTAEDHIEHRIVSNHYFDAMRIRILKGQSFSESDHEGAQAVAIVSQSVADRFWPGADPLGRRIRYTDQDGAPWITVVGVADNIVEDWYWGRASLTMYRPFSQTPPSEFALAVRAGGDPAALTGQIRAAVRTVDPERPLGSITPMQQLIHERLSAPRTISAVMGTLSVLALVLAAIGLYGVIAHLVGQRTHEIGLRLAFGASRRNVARLVVSDAMRLAGAGLLIGAVLAVGAGRLVEAALSGVTALDFSLIAGLMLIVAAVGLVATYLPARRAARIEPAVALRIE